MPTSPENFRSAEDVADLSSSFDAAVLSSSGSRTPFVYTDAGGGREKNGIYTIDRAFAL